MKIQILSVGKKHSSEIAEAIDDFTQRIGHYADIDWKLIQSDDNLAKESELILKALDPKDYVFLLDEKGKEMSSVDFSGLLEKIENMSPKRVVFVIGGAYGVDENVRNRASTVLALSKLTFPHQIVRLILAEQIYRAFTIIKGGKYHHQ